MTSFLPINGLVNVEIDLSVTSAQAQSLTNLLVLGPSDIIDTQQRIRTYNSLSQVVQDFGTTAPEYLSADAWFSQSPQPQQISIGRWAQTSTSARLVGAIVSNTNQLASTWASITSAGFAITANGGSSTSVFGINFNGVTNLNGVASIINSALENASVNATITWNSVNQQFTLESGVTGTSSTLSFLSASSGTDITFMLGMNVDSSGAYVVDGMDAETAVNAVALFDAYYGQKWYGLFIPTAVDSDHVEVAAYIEGGTNKHIYFVNTQEAGVFVSTDTNNIGYQLKTLGYRHTSVQYSSFSMYAIVSYAAKALTIDYNANNSVINLMWKQEPGIGAESITSTQLAALIANNVNIFVNYDNGMAIVQNGVNSSGDYTDIITGTDWFAITAQNTLANILLTTPTKLAQTDQGNGILKAGLVSVCERAVNNGLVAPGVWDQAGFGVIVQNQFLDKGYYVYQPSVLNQPKVDRDIRKSVAFQVAIKLAGAINTASVLVNVNR